MRILKKKTRKEETVVNLSLSTSPYKGTNDSYPEEMYYRNYLFGVWKETAKSYGYDEYDTPLIEEASLYKVKSGEELVNNQLYSFTDKGGREIAIRPELTPSLARIIAARRKELPFPLRLFNLGRFYRYEKPQRGRTREFFQLNIDILGVEDITAELEIIQFVIDVMKKLNAPKNTYELKINSRLLLEFLYEEILKLEEDKRPAITKAIDNYLKIEKESFKEYLSELGLSRDQSEKLEDFLKWDITDLEKIADKSQGAKDLKNLFEEINLLGIGNVKFAPYVVRGLDYYTGIVIEMFDIGGNKNPRALFGGGRYDNLMEIFDQEKVPAFGLGWGDITTLDYLKTYNLLPPYKPNTKVLVTLMDQSLLSESFRIAAFLRENGINTETELSQRKLTKQLKYANRKSVPWIIIIGEEEMKENKVLLKNMQTSEEFKLSPNDIISKLQ
jgi:histidyl-tRNA synthetase